MDIYGNQSVELNGLCLWHSYTVCVVTRYRKLRGKLTENEAGKFLIPFLCVELESCKRREFTSVSHLEFTSVTNSDNPRNLEDFSLALLIWLLTLPASKPQMSPSWIVFVFSLYNSLCLLSGSLGFEHFSSKSANNNISPF